MIYIISAVLLMCVSVFIIIPYICYRKAFYTSGKSHGMDISNDKDYLDWRGQMLTWKSEVYALPCRRVEIKSRDGLVLSGRYFEYSPDAPIEILFHGYKGRSDDLCAGVIRCRAVGHSTLLVDQRASGESEGHTVSFGVLEKDDCLLWVDYVVKNINPHAKIILSGVSMGASTVMLASCQPLAQNVVGVLADCGYSSGEKIIKKIIAQMKLPPKAVYPLLRLGGKMFAGFDIKEADCTRAVAQSRVPIIFYHGDSDGFVPCEMSRENYKACVSRKKLIIIKGAGHGLCFPVNPEEYISALKEFFGE